MCSNCALRSGCVAPSCRLRGLIAAGSPGGAAARPISGTKLTRHPCSVSAAASFARLLTRPAQRRGRVAARERIHQRLERGLTCRVDPAGCGAVRRQGVGCGPYGASSRASIVPNAPCESSPEPHRWPMRNRPRRRRSRWRATRPSPEELHRAEDCARPSHGRDTRHTSQPGSLPVSMSRFIRSSMTSNPADGKLVSRIVLTGWRGYCEPHAIRERHGGASCPRRRPRTGPPETAP